MNDHSGFTSLPISNAYAQFLERLTNEEFWHLAAESAHPLSFGEPLPADHLSCRLRHGRCLLPLALLREVVSPPYHFTSLPAVPPWMPGVSAWHSEIVAVIDLDAYLSNTTTNMDTGHTDSMNGILLIMHCDNLTLALFVSSVEITIALEPEQVIPFAPIAQKYTYTRTDILKGVKHAEDEQGGDCFVLDIPALFADIVQHLAK